MENSNITLTPEQAASKLRRAGVKISAQTIRDGIEQGVFPFGIAVIQGKRNIFISAKKLSEWCAEWFGVAV